MKHLLEEVIMQGGYPTYYGRIPTVFGNEATLRWRRHLNSPTEYVRIAYNVSDFDHKVIFALFADKAKSDGWMLVFVA